MEIDQSLRSFWVNPINQCLLINDGGRKGRAKDSSQIRLVGTNSPADLIDSLAVSYTYGGIFLTDESPSGVHGED